jgi:hypothetical protein
MTICSTCEEDMPKGHESTYLLPMVSFRIPFTPFEIVWQRNVTAFTCDECASEDQWRQQLHEAGIFDAGAAEGFQEGVRSTYDRMHDLGYRV